MHQQAIEVNAALDVGLTMERADVGEVPESVDNALTGLLARDLCVRPFLLDNGMEHLVRVGYDLGKAAGRARRMEENREVVHAHSCDGCKRELGLLAVGNSVGHELRYLAELE